MSHSSAGDAAIDLESAKTAEGEENTGEPDNDTTQLATGIGQGEGLEGSIEGEKEEEEEEEEEEEKEGVEEEDLRDDEEKESVREEEESLEPQPEPKEPEEVREEVQTKVEERPKHEIEVNDLQPDEEVLEEEEVEEYEYTKDEIKYMKTAFVAYQIEKQPSKQSPRKPDKKTEPKTTEIPIGTLGSVLRSLGLNPTELALQSYVEWLGVDPKKGTVKFEELLIIVGREKKVMIDESHVLEAFRLLDVEKQGVIPIETLRNFLVLTCERFSPEEWIIFVHLADPKKTGFVDYENFVARMGPNPPVPEKTKKGKKGKKK